LDVFGAFLRCEAFEQGADALPSCFDCSLGGFSEQRFQLGEHLLDGIEIGTIRRQEEKPGPDRADGPSHGVALVTAEIVHDDDVAGLERRHEELLDIGFEAFAIDRSIKDARCVDPVVPQGRKECKCLPMPVRRLSAQALPSRPPAMGADHVGFCPGLINEDEAGGINLSLMPFPACPSARDVGPVLLGRQQRFF
jgi:hypothetical protein